jgi:hypothetical protein
MDRKMTIAAEHHRVPNASKPFEPEYLGWAENCCPQPQNLLEYGVSPVDSYVGTKTMVATEQDWIRNVVARHREWIESVQGVAIEKTVILDASNNLLSFAAREMLRGVRLTKPQQGPLAKLRKEVMSIECRRSGKYLLSRQMSE